MTVRLRWTAGHGCRYQENHHETCQLHLNLQNVVNSANRFARRPIMSTEPQAVKTDRCRSVNPCFASKGNPNALCRSIHHRESNHLCRRRYSNPRSVSQPFRHHQSRSRTARRVSRIVQTVRKATRTHGLPNSRSASFAELSHQRCKEIVHVPIIGFCRRGGSR